MIYMCRNGQMVSRLFVLSYSLNKQSIRLYICFKAPKWIINYQFPLLQMELWKLKLRFVPEVSWKKLKAKKHLSAVIQQAAGLDSGLIAHFGWPPIDPNYPDLRAQEEELKP